MGANPLARQGGLSYLEIPSTDAEASATFYAKVVGWKTHRDAKGVWKFEEAAGLLIGKWSSRPPGTTGFLPYVYVLDVRAAVGRAPGCGGAIVKPPTPEGDILLAQVRDPAGNVLGLWQFA